MKTKPVNSVDIAFRAFSDWTRLRILNLLRGGELCVCDLTDVLETPQPGISRHLAYLRKAKLVIGRKDGLWSYYRLAPARDPFHQSLLESLAACVQNAPELATDTKRLAARGKRCC
jgi:ArsR family transcriptional regulator, arsenate/arsenite/antimonite-responsive transcriptional repressor